MIKARQDGKDRSYPHGMLPASVDGVMNWSWGWNGVQLKSVTGGPRQPIPAHSVVSDQPACTDPRVGRTGHSGWSPELAVDTEANAGTPVQSHSGQSSEASTTGKSASQGSDETGSWW